MKRNVLDALSIHLGGTYYSGFMLYQFLYRARLRSATKRKVEEEERERMKARPSGVYLESLIPNVARRG
jgi:hypothetical protein